MRTQYQNVSDLAAAVHEAAAQNLDAVVDTRNLRLEVCDDQPILHASGLEGGGFDLTKWSERQVTAWAGVPAKYYERMRTKAPELLETNVNHWFHEEPERRMLRCRVPSDDSGTLRAFLSDRYRRIDHEVILQGAVQGLEPLMADAGGIEVRELAMDERRMSLKVSFPKVEGEVGVGDVVQSGVWISNSEIGQGSVSVMPFIYRLICLNGLTIPDGSIKRRHVGQKLELGESVRFSADTMDADDHAIALKVRDAVAAMATDGTFQQTLERMKEATHGPLIGNPVKAAEVLAKTTILSGTERDGFMENLIRGQDYSRWGAVNAVTVMANNAKMDRAQDLHEIGGSVLNLAPSEWSRVAEAA